MEIPKDLPNEIRDMIMMHLDTCTIYMMGERYVSPYVWARKKDPTLHDAIKAGNLLGAKYLIEYHIDNFTEHEYGKCSEYSHALQLSTKYGRIDILNYLINEHSTDIHADQNNILLLSARRGNRILLST
jgi:hypothetical protein